MQLTMSSVVLLVVLGLSICPELSENKDITYNSGEQAEK